MVTNIYIHIHIIHPLLVPPVRQPSPRPGPMIIRSPDHSVEIYRECLGGTFSVSRCLGTRVLHPGSADLWTQPWIFHCLCLCQTRIWIGRHTQGRSTGLIVTLSFPWMPIKYGHALSVPCWQKAEHRFMCTAKAVEVKTYSMTGTIFLAWSIFIDGEIIYIYLIE